MSAVPPVQTEYGADDPIWIDEAWLDTVVVVGLTCFVLCLMNLSKVRPEPEELPSLVSNLDDLNEMWLSTIGFHFQNGNGLRYCWYDCAHRWILARRNLHIR